MKLPKKHRFKIILLALLLAIAFGQRIVYFFTNPYTDNNLEIHCLDVGQGDSTLIAGSSQIMLIDAAEQEYSDEISLYLREKGVKKIDVLVATHPHDDHIGGMADLMDQFRIGCLVLTEEYSSSSAYQEMLSAAEDYNISIIVPSPGETIPFADASCTVLGPLSIDEDNSNNNSIILRIEFGENKFLFTGDAEKEEERELIESGTDLSADFLHAGHHGSDTSSNSFFLSRVNPDCTVISCGVGNSFGHPSPEALERLKKWSGQIFRTDLEGTIVISSDGRQLYRKMPQ